MKKYFLIIVLILISCKEKKETTETEIIKTADYELIKVNKQKGLLILFPCFPCNAENTLTEFNISKISTDNGFSVLAMNLNRLLYLKLEEKQDLEKLLISIIKENNLVNENIFIGGFSGGGNVSLLISDYLVKRNSKIQPKGVFSVDSPIDMLGLYRVAKRNIKRNFSDVSIQEATWIIDKLDKEFGDPKNGLTNYEKYSPYTFETQNIENLKGLKKLKVRLYTEPDVEWWKENRKNNYEDLNAFYFKNLSNKLKSTFQNNKVELIETKDRGYRINGDRHPHSWSIVDEKELIKWMIKG